MTDSTISDLILDLLEFNVARYEECRLTDFGLGIDSEVWAEFKELPYKQAKLRAEYVNALKAEGKSVDDVSALCDDSPVAPVPGLRVENHGGAIRFWAWGEFGVDFFANDLKTEMEQYPNSPIQLHINSEGGAVSEGVAVHELIRSHAAPVDVVVDALAASAASFSIMAADSISMARGSYQMIHHAHASMSGATAADFEAAAKRMREVNESIKAYYLPRWKGTEAQLDKALDSEKYFSAEECVAAGLADEVISVERVAACVGSRWKQLHEDAPAELSIAARGGPSQFLNQRQMVLHRLITTEK